MENMVTEPLKKGIYRRKLAKEPKTRRILVVDDEESVGVGMSGILKDAGFEAHYATGGTDALKEVEKRPYSLIFMDMIMPGMNGLDTFRKIKGARKGINVVLFTGFFKDADRMIYDGIREGMIDEFIRKPFFTAEIIKIAKKYA
ncbi:MAG: response regulator [Deltaproteobacteria bacterium]|nr:response regulator [Deltaproteobacteria bacterium]